MHRLLVKTTRLIAGDFFLETRLFKNTRLPVIGFFLETKIFKNTRLPIVGFLFLLFELSGCATLQSDALLQSAPDFPPTFELTSVPFFPQAEYQCGPAALATVLAHNGVSITPDNLVSQVYLPERQGSVQPEMIAASRRYQHIPYVIQPRMQDVLQEVAAGHPVLILQNLGLSWIPTWHYAVVIGYDLQQGVLILRSGIESRHVVALRVFERTWARANYWGMVVLPANQMPATAEEQKYLATVREVEKIAGSDVAIQAYRQALQRWPQSYAFRMSLGNSLYGQGAWQNAADAFNHALVIQPQSADAWNNLADTLLQMHDTEAAYHAAQHALELGGPRVEIYRQTLRQIERMRVGK
jgi:hypothetical protein